jgi:hypothetical protein
VWTDSPGTDGNLTVLTRHDGGDREVFVYNSDTRNYEQATSNTVEDSYPRVSGKYVAWVGGEGSASEIYLAVYVGDSDGDGVPDHLDACPEQDATGYDTDGDGCIDDSDGDGVLDNVDVCPAEDATGFDIDGDGCIDNLGELKGIVDTLVAEGVISEVLRNSLISKVENAEKSFGKENICAAVNKLEALKNEVNAQTGKKIAEEAAVEVIAYADSIINWLLFQLPSGDSC